VTATLERIRVALFGVCDRCGATLPLRRWRAGTCGSCAPS